MDSATRQEDGPPDQVGYFELLRTNADYRRIWIGDVASLLGDWFNAIALYVLLRRLTGSPMALGLVFITKMLPWALASPVAGWLNDRYNRRRLMIGSDLIRAVVVLGFLLVEEPSQVWLIYLLSALQVMVGSVFVPARSASIPNITSDRELLTANALSAATWSTLLAVGAALGGFVTEWAGVKAVFVMDSASYLVSAFFIYRAAIPQETESTGPATIRGAYAELVDGWRHLRTHPAVARMTLAKPTWGIAGSALVYMLALLGEEVAAATPAIGMGLLFGARGFGTGVGPIAVRAWIPDERKWPMMLGLGIAASGLFYLAVGATPWVLWLVVPLVILAHAPSGANWVSSTVLLQKRTVDRFRGRVFATEWLLITLVDALSIFVAGALLELGVLDLRSGILAFAGLQVLCGVGWLVFVVPRER